jgi:hypothetical protein
MRVFFTPVLKLKILFFKTIPWSTLIALDIVLFFFQDSLPSTTEGKCGINAADRDLEELSQ